MRELDEVEVFLVLKYAADGQHEFCGVFSSTEKAAAVALSLDKRSPDGDRHCVCPATIDKEAPDSREEWPGCFYPDAET